MATGQVTSTLVDGSAQQTTAFMSTVHDTMPKPGTGRAVLEQQKQQSQVLEPATIDKVCSACLLLLLARIRNLSQAPCLVPEPVYTLVLRKEVSELTTQILSESRQLLERSFCPFISQLVGIALD